MWAGGSTDLFKLILLGVLESRRLCKWKHRVSEHGNNETAPPGTLGVLHLPSPKSCSGARPLSPFSVSLKGDNQRRFGKRNN